MKGIIIYIYIDKKMSRRGGVIRVCMHGCVCVRT